MPRTSNREQVNQKVISEIEKAHNQKKGWTNIKDVENKLVELESQYKKAKNTNTKVRVRKLIDVYEKQVKALNIKNIKMQQSKTEKLVTMNTINEEEESDSEISVMSDVTAKTNNTQLGYRSELKRNHKGEREKSKTDTPLVLESLGKTRNAKPNKNNIASTEKPNESEKENESPQENREINRSYVQIVTQDDATVMSEITINQNQESSKDDKGECKSIQDEEDKDVYMTVMSNVTSTTCNSAEINKDIKGKDIEKEGVEEKEKAVPETVHNPYNKRKDGGLEVNKSENENHSTPHTYVQATKNQVNWMSVNLDSENEANRDENGKYIRVRFSFIGENDNEPKNRVKKRIVYEAMQCAKVIDKSSALMPWNRNTNMKTLNGDEAKLIDEKSIGKYIDMPSKNESISRGDMYYSNGLRIKTNMDVGEFTERWNNKK